MSFKKPQIQGFDYPQYNLKFNPFVMDVDAIEGVGDAVVYRNHIYARESKRVIAKINEWIDKGETCKLWIIKDMGVDHSHHIYLSGGILRHLMAYEPTLRIFPTLALLTVIYKAVTDNILKMVLDRFTIEKYRLCLFSYVYQSLEQLVEEGVDEQALPGIDVPALLKEIEDTDGAVLEDILYKSKGGAEAEKAGAEESADEEGEAAVEEPADDEAEPPQVVEEDGRAEETPEEEGEKEAETVEDEAAAAERERLLNLRNAIEKAVGIQFERSTFEFFAKEIVGRGLRSLEEGFGFLKAGGVGVDALNEILKFMSFYYRTAFVLVDRIDGWAMLEDEERRRIYAELGEWQWVVGQKGCVALVAGPRFADATDPSFLATAYKAETDLHDVERPVDRTLTVEEAQDMVVSFLSAARPDGAEASIAPFTEEALEQMVEGARGNVLEFLKIAGEVLDRASEKGLSEIGAEEVGSVSV